MFQRRSHELGAVCYFSCREGFILTGASTNKCTLTQGGRAAKFNVTGGKCELPGAADNHSNRTGPFYIYPAAKPNYHLSWDSNNRLVLTNVTGKHHMFYIIKPGSNGHLDTVSFQSAADPTLYIVKEAQGLKVLQKKQIHPSLGSWETVTSFFIFQNKFQSGYYGIQPIKRPNLYFIYTLTNTVTLQWSYRQSVFNPKKASFFWKDP
ncbi:uncharacterized protein LOC143446920 isoform X2 [Clavelina lepadiformis]